MGQAMQKPLKTSYWQAFAKLIGFILCIISINACKSGENGGSSGFYHNLTARFNPYFIARNRMDSVELNIFNQRKDNYNRVLEVIPTEDTTSLRQYDTRTKDVLKKAYIVHNRHEESKLLYASYILIGKARYYLRQYDQALEILKHVNVKAKEPVDQNRALIELLKIYTELKDEKSALITLNVLQQRKFEEEKVEFYLARGHFFRRQNDYRETAKSLGSAVLEMKKSEKRGRIYFILGQLYEKLGNNDLAYNNYKQVIRNNPPYELAFYAQLAKTQVAGTITATDIKKTKRYFKKLLTDTKNKEYQDKIYYEMGKFELRQDKIPEAIASLKKSLAVSQNPMQKGYTYLKLAEINYANLKNYEMAKTYYDSTVATLPKNVEEYKAIEKRQKTLDEFVKQLLIYRTEDSLQRIAKMPETERETYIQTQLEKVESRKYDVEDSLRVINEKNAKNKNNAPSQLGTLEELNASNTAGWYFDNPAAIAKGQQEFVKKWGRRPLDDDWRRSNKIVISNNTQGNPKEEVPVFDAKIIRKETIKKNVEERKKALYAALPQKPEDFVASDKKIEDALYNLGKIYRFKLEEPENTIESLEKLLGRFPQTNYEAESLYLLYLTAKDLKKSEIQEKYKQLLLTRHPNSSYAKIISDPDFYAKARKNEDSVKAIYKRAYAQYELGNFAQSLSQIERIKTDFPQNLMGDKIELLTLILEFKLNRNRENFTKSLEEFNKKFPETDLKSFVSGLLQSLGKKE